MKINEEQIKLCALYLLQNYGTEILLGSAIGVTLGLSICNAMEIAQIKRFLKRSIKYGD